MALTRKDFGANPHAGANRNNAAARGWGSGWPHCQGSKMTTVSGGGVRVTVRREVGELVAVLLDITAARGYKPKSGQCWGYACRQIRGSSSSSNHAWGLAVDINSLANPMQSTFRTDIPPAVVADWEACGWYWGGRYTSRPDTMHFEYIGRPADVAGHLKKAKAILAKLRGKPAPKPPAATWRARVDAKPGSRVVARWDQGDDVGLLQRFLGIRTDDGRFDDVLEEKVRAYQKMRGLVVDGKVGPLTWAPILKALGI